MNKYFILLVLVLFGSTLFAGRYAGDFMSIGAGVRPLGMGGAFTAVADDGTAIYWNASGIAQIRKTEITLMHAFLYNGLATYDNFTFCQPLPNDVTIGANLTRLTIDGIPVYEETYLVGTNVDQRAMDPDLHLPGTPQDKFTSTDDLYQFAFSKHSHYQANMGWQFFEIPFDIYIGGNAKFIKRKMLDKLGSGMGVDLSLMGKTDLAVIFDQDWMGKLSLGLNLQDVSGTTVTWDVASNHEDEILFNSKWGFAIEQPVPQLKSVVLLAVDTDYAYRTVQHFGLEWEYNQIAAVRTGYYDKNFTAGASFKVYGWNVDYAFVTNPLGMTNRVGLRVSF